MKEIIENLKHQILTDKEAMNDPDKASWGYKAGVLITSNEAKKIIRALEKKS